MSKEYLVTIPIAGAVNVVIEADSEAEAKEKALNVPFTCDIESEAGLELVEIDVYEKITSGNVMYAPYNNIKVEEA